MTGAPVGIYLHDQFSTQTEQLWKLLQNADKAQYVMCTAVSKNINKGKSGLTGSDLTKVGLVDSHAYSLIAALEVSCGPFTKERLLMLRNPWGFREWSGDWSDTSSKWRENPGAIK